MQVQEVSKYKDNLIATRKKAAFAVLVDYFLVFIVTFALFYFALPISINVPSINKSITDLNECRDSALKFINSTHLLHYEISESGYSSRNIELDSKAYVNTLVKTSAFIYDYSFPKKNDDGTYNANAKVEEDDTFIYNHDEYPLDNISYFIIQFSNNHLEMNAKTYDGVDYSSDLETLIYKKIMEYETLDDYDRYFANETNESYKLYKNKLSKYQILNETITKSLINYIAYNDETNEDAVKLYKNLNIAYQNGIQHCINLVENKCDAYISISNAFNKQYTTYSGAIVITYLITYLISYLLVLFLSRVFNKEWNTFGNRVRYLNVATRKELTPKPWNLIIYHVCSFILYSSSIFISFFFTNFFGALNLKVIGPINLMMIFVFILTLDIISFIMMLITKDRTSLSLLASNLYLKDINETENMPVEGSKLLDNIENNNGTK